MIKTLTTIKDKYMNLPKIIDNDRKSLLEVIETVSIDHKEVSIATGYWDLPGTELILETFEHFDKIRLLIGREPAVPRDNREQIEPDFPDEDFYRDLQRLSISSNHLAVVKKIKQWIDLGKLEVKVYKSDFLHAKCYIFGNYESDIAVGIIGSSNFTRNGLTKNTELNALENDHRVVTFQPMSQTQEVGHLAWFDKFWNSDGAVEWSGQFKQILETSPVGDKLFSPYEMYIKTLYELYKDELEDEDLTPKEGGKYTLYNFQLKNVNALRRRLSKYKVAMLSDSVGLGKTVTAIEVIKHYIDSDQGKKRVEVICPKSLKQQWIRELRSQEVMYLTPTTLQNLGEIEEKIELDNIASVSLFVIDESHNLKNSSGARFEKILEWIRNNPNAHVLLLTATPINNQLTDVTNQILLGTRGETEVLKVTVVDKKTKQTVQISFKEAVENLRKKISKEIKSGEEIDYDYIQQVMRPILRTFVVRRTRQGILQEYGTILEDGRELKFPKVIPEVVKYSYDPNVTATIQELTHPSIDLQKLYRLSPNEIIEHTKRLAHPLDQITDLLNGDDKTILSDKSPIFFVYQVVLLLGFIPYRWKMYQSQFYGKTKSQISELRLPSKESKSLFLQLSIYGILRTMFLKRMESSVAAIQSSLDTYERKLEIFEKGLDDGKIISLKNLANIESQLGFGDEDYLFDDIEIDQDDILDHEVNDITYNLSALKNDIQKEKQLIDILHHQLDLLQSDPSKTRAFVNLIEHLQTIKPAGSKVLVFSYYADTIEYLRKTLPAESQLINDTNTAFLSSKNGAESEDLARRFSPVSKKHQIAADESELNYLLSTDVLSEGQNLQDCGVLINFDLHWNPVRMIQRNGRVNRLGSSFDQVYIYNIAPESQLEEYLQLVNRLEGKINLIRNTIGTDSPVLDETENPLEFTDSIKDIYSEDLLTRIKANESAEKDADMLLAEDEFVTDLKKFHNNPDFSVEYKKSIYEKVPHGKWGVMCSNQHRGESRPQVLVLNELKSKQHEFNSHLFVSMDERGQSLQAVTSLQALEWLRCDENNNQRENDHISLDKQRIAETADNRVETYFQDEELGAPVGQQRDILRILYENQYSPEDIEIVEKAFTTTNEFDLKRIAKLKRDIIRLSRIGEPHLELLQELVKVSKETLSKPKSLIQFDTVSQIAFYVRENK